MSKIVIIAFALEGIGLVALLSGAVIWLSGGNPGFILSFILGQAFFNMGVMFHLGYLTAVVRRK